MTRDWFDSLSRLVKVGNIQKAVAVRKQAGRSPALGTVPPFIERCGFRFRGSPRIPRTQFGVSPWGPESAA